MSIGPLTQFTQEILNHVNRRLFSVNDNETEPSGDFAKTLQSIENSLQSPKTGIGSGKSIARYLAEQIPALSIGQVSTKATQQKDTPQSDLSGHPSKTREVSKSEKIPAVREGTQAAKPYEKERIEKAIAHAAEQYNIAPSLIRAVIQAESSFRSKAVSKAGAKGLMQLMPATAKELGVKDPFNIEQNISGGTKYLRRMLDLFGGDPQLAVAAYNAGPGTIIRSGGRVPYQETLAYVDRVMNLKSQYELA
jgi:soluble lytic murein transglycosylase-like protein